jgi:hypothetical protein
VGDFMRDFARPNRQAEFALRRLSVQFIELPFEVRKAFHFLAVIFH